MEPLEGLPSGPLVVYRPNDNEENNLIAVLAEEFDSHANLIVPIANERINRLSATQIVRASKGTGAGSYGPIEPAEDSVTKNEPELSEPGE